MSEAVFYYAESVKNLNNFLFLRQSIITGYLIA